MIDAAPTYGLALMQDQMLTSGVMWRRVVAWLLDICFQAPMYFLLFLMITAFGFLTFGLGWSLFPGLVAFSFLYNILFIASPISATPGQAIMGLKLRRNNDLSRPTIVEALVFTIGLYVTLMLSGLLVLVAIVTSRHRTLHDMLSGLVVIRARGLTPPAAIWNTPGYR